MNDAPYGGNLAQKISPFPSPTESLVARIRSKNESLVIGEIIPHMPVQKASLREVWDGEGDYAIPIVDGPDSGVQEGHFTLDETPGKVDLYRPDELKKGRYTTLEHDPRPAVMPREIRVFPGELRDVTPREG